MRLGLTAAAAFVATVWLANWLVTHYGVVPVGFDLEAPAGVFAVGVAFTLRDIVQRTLGRGAVVAAILVGCALSYWLGASATIPGGEVTIAVASAAAFLLSEFSDLIVYTPLERRDLIAAVAVSNTVGTVVDSYLFLTLAFGSLTFFWGQVVGKSWMTLAALPLLIASRRLVRGVT